MKVLKNVAATPEQLQVLQHRFRKGILIIRGAAGSGKTTTALLRIRHLLVNWGRALRRSEKRDPRVLVLTYNRTLRGYIAELAEQQVSGVATLEIDTFARWALRRLGCPKIAQDDDVKEKLADLLAQSSLPHDSAFIKDEVFYVLGRLMPDQLATYPTDRFQRDGRGLAPRITRAQRQTLLDKVIIPYRTWKAKRGLCDWTDLAVDLSLQARPPFYDIVVVDETQDFTANRVRAVLKHIEKRSSVTFVLDAAQRIYPDFFSWKEVGVTANPLTNVCTLRVNYRNTKEIAACAKPLVDGLAMGPDASLPDLTACVRHGPKPQLVVGSYSDQVDWALNYIGALNLSEQSVAFLHPLGWLTFLRSRLRDAGLRWVELKRNREWPGGPDNIALSTMHSVKGLEFDHVLMLGLNDQVIDCGDDPDHVALESARRLLAMSLTRARESVIIGYSPDDVPVLADFLDPSTIDKLVL